MTMKGKEEVLRAACCVVAELKPFANPFGGIGMDRHKKRSNIYIRYFELYDGDTI